MQSTAALAVAASSEPSQAVHPQCAGHTNVDNAESVTSAFYKPPLLHQCHRLAKIAVVCFLVRWNASRAVINATLGSHVNDTALACSANYDGTIRGVLR